MTAQSHNKSEQPSILVEIDEQTLTVVAVEGMTLFFDDALFDEVSGEPVRLEIRATGQSTFIDMVGEGSGAELAVQSTEATRVILAALESQFDAPQPNFLTDLLVRLQEIEPKAQPPAPVRRISRRRRIRRAIRKLPAILTIAALATFIVDRIDKRTGEVLVSTGLIVLPATGVQAPATGMVVFIEQSGQVEKGQPIAGVQSTSGRQIFIPAPIDGLIVNAYVTQGARVSRGEVLVDVARRDQEPRARLFLPLGAAFRLADGAFASVRFADGADRNYEINDSNYSWEPSSAIPANPGVAITFPLPGEDADKAGSLVQVTFRPADYGLSRTERFWKMILSPVDIGPLGRSKEA